MNPTHLSPAILRILDANCNRAREAMRVLEDYARFALNSTDLSERLKALRHDFQRATSSLQAHAVAARDTAGDVGAGITTQTEQKRESAGAVVTAAGKRLGEALRTIEEYAKVSGQTAAIESLRYRFYDIEKQILLTLSPGRERMRDVALCVLITESICRGPWLEVAESAIDGGADCLQLREKTLEGAELLARAKQLVALCRRRNVISIINDRPDIALLADADGVHVGQDDLPAIAVRQLLGPDKIIGVSTHCIEQARQAVLDGADYIGVGPIFPSLTKPKPDLAGLRYGGQVAAEIGISAVAISGITPENVDAVMRAGLRSIAVSSAVIGASDPAAAARALKDAIATYRSKG